MKITTTNFINKSTNKAIIAWCKREIKQYERLIKKLEK